MKIFSLLIIFGLMSFGVFAQTNSTDQVEIGIDLLVDKKGILKNLSIRQGDSIEDIATELNSLPEDLSHRVNRSRELAEWILNHQYPEGEITVRDKILQIEKQYGEILGFDKRGISFEVLASYLDDDLTRSWADLKLNVSLKPDVRIFGSDRLAIQLNSKDIRFGRVKIENHIYSIFEFLDLLESTAKAMSGETPEKNKLQKSLQEDGWSKKQAPKSKFNNV